jgi:hypothetical protein
MPRWLLLALAVAASGCAPAAVDALPSPTPQPTRPTLSLPTHAAAGTTLPHIGNSWDLTPVPRTPFALRTYEGGPVPSADGTITAVAIASPTAPASTATRTPLPTPTPHAHRYVVSIRARSSYYCDTDPEWKNLSAANLRWYDDEKSLRDDYPRLTLHEPCD